MKKPLRDAFRLHFSDIPAWPGHNPVEEDHLRCRETGQIDGQTYDGQIERLTRAMEDCVLCTVQYANFLR